MKIGVHGRGLTPNAFVFLDQGESSAGHVEDPKSLPESWWLPLHSGWSSASQSLSAPVGTGRITVRMVHPGSISPRATVTLSKSPKVLD